VKAAERALRGSCAKDLVVLLDETRWGAFRDLVAMPPDGAFEGRVDRKVDARRERDGPQHPDRIFVDARLRIANRPHDARLKVLESADVVNDRKRGDVVRERVDREVAAKRVFFRRAEGVVVMDEVAAFGGRRIRRRHAVGDDLFARRQLTPERCDLDDLGAELDVREPEAAADDPAVPEQLLHLRWMRGRADVEVLGPAAEQQIADAAADEIRDVIGFAQPVEHLEGVGVDVSTRDRVLGPRHDPRDNAHLSLRLLPVRADADVDGEGHVQHGRSLHAVARLHGVAGRRGCEP